MKNIFEKFSGNGSHCGLSDFYESQNQALVKAIKAGKSFTTGWWSSKKECASGKIDFDGKKFTISVTVSDDFDTEGICTDSFTISKKNLKDAEKVLEVISNTLNTIWDGANENQKDNRTWAMYCIGKEVKGKRTNWIETYLVNVAGWETKPPGDNYSEWGYQGDCKIPANIKKNLKEGMDLGNSVVKYKGWMAELVD